MVDNFTVAPIIEPKINPSLKRWDNEEKVEVLIKEVVRIRPRDFEAFKHALEDFVKDWD